VIYAIHLHHTICAGAGLLPSIRPDGYSLIFFSDVLQGANITRDTFPPTYKSQRTPSLAFVRFREMFGASVTAVNEQHDAIGHTKGIRNATARADRPSPGNGTENLCRAESSCPLLHQICSDICTAIAPIL
jgi:hypothetical protein